MKIAAIYWPTSSVGGINTELMCLRAEAEKRGHEFHVLRSGKHSKIKPGLFGERKTIRGGDTNIIIDGEAPHHEDVVDDSISWINATYDMVYYAFLCPHPTKDYGNEPIFKPMFSDILLPKAGRITDAYWEDYKEWGEWCVDQCDVVTAVHEQAVLDHLYPQQVSLAAAPLYLTNRPAIKRSSTCLTVWTSQWKAIKGVHKLLPVIPKIPGDMELYSNGILYYQLRYTDEWKRAVGQDFFKPEFSGEGRATFHGYVPLDDIQQAYQRGWFMIDLMGLGRPKHATYRRGAVNLTAIEALYHGCCPILHDQARARIPVDLARFVSDPAEIPDIVRRGAFAIDPKRQRKAREWVLRERDPSTFFDKVLGL